MADASACYTNPLDVKVADPHIFEHEGRYYLYGTAADPRDVDRGFPVWVSEDLVHWTGQGLALEPQPGDWGRYWFWGPEVHEKDGAFLMFYGAFRKTAEGRDEGRICLARAESPLGPFREIKAPLFDWHPGREAIDASVFVDEDGSAYMYFTSVHGGNFILAAPLAEDWQALAAEPVLCLEPRSQPWEVDAVNEGAYVFRHDGQYVMLYAGNDFRNPAYSVGVATAPAPLGPWTKHPANPIVSRSDHIAGPGCACVLPGPEPGEYYIYYHCHLSADGYVRQLALDRLSLCRLPGGALEFHTFAPDTRPQPLPEGLPRRAPGASDSFDAPELDRQRWLIVDERPGHWGIEDGALWIDTQDGDCWQGRADYRNLFLQRAPEGDFAVALRLDFTPRADYEQAFVCIWQSADHYVRLALVHDGQPRLSLGAETDQRYHALSIEAPAQPGPLELRLERRGPRLRAFWRPDADEVWQPVGEELMLPFPLPRVGLGALSPGSGEKRRARFLDFRIETLD